MIRLLYALVLGLALAGVTHVASLLGVTRLATGAAFDRLAPLGADGRFVVLPEDGALADMLPFRDPAFVTAACRYDVGPGPVAVRAVLPSTYGALAVHNRSGQPFYALTDKAATDGVVEVTVLAADDVPEAELDEPEGRPAIRIVSPTSEGFVLVRLFAPQASARTALATLAAQATCARAPQRAGGP